MTGNPGICSSGVTVCQSGVIVCDGFVDPATEPETCNGTDDDCDFQIDEDVPVVGSPCSTGSPGVCESGTFVCNSGSLECSAIAPGSQLESCNGLDDDCDGQVDEGGVCD
jgi:Notch-like protein